MRLTAAPHLRLRSQAPQISSRAEPRKVLSRWPHPTNTRSCDRARERHQADVSGGNELQKQFIKLLAEPVQVGASWQRLASIFTTGPTNAEDAFPRVAAREGIKAISPP